MRAICAKDPRIKAQKTTATTRDTVPKRDCEPDRARVRSSQLMHAMRSKPGIRENQFGSSLLPSPPPLLPRAALAAPADSRIDRPPRPRLIRARPRSLAGTASRGDIAISRTGLRQDCKKLQRSTDVSYNQPVDGRQREKLVSRSFTTDVRLRRFPPR